MTASVKPPLALKKRLLSARQWQQPNIVLGQYGEEQAVHFLISQGFQVLERNCRVGNDEVDVIAWDRDAHELVLVEVKTRQNDQFGWGSNAVDRRKIARMQRVARAYIRARQLRVPFRFDIICVVGAQIDHHQNVTWNG